MWESPNDPRPEGGALPNLARIRPLCRTVHTTERSSSVWTELADACLTVQPIMGFWNRFALTQLPSSAYRLFPCLVGARLPHDVGARLFCVRKSHRPTLPTNEIETASQKPQCTQYWAGEPAGGPAQPRVSGPLPPLSKEHPCPSNTRRWLRQYSHRGFWRCIFQLVLLCAMCAV